MNSPRAALNTHRDRLPALMIEARLPFPQTNLVATNGSPDLHGLDLDEGIWLKRGDVHASVTADVQWIDSWDRLEMGLADFARREINLAALQAHRAGDEIKFYGVAGGGLFSLSFSPRSRQKSSLLWDALPIRPPKAGGAGRGGLWRDVSLSS